MSVLDMRLTQLTMGIQFQSFGECEVPLIAITPWSTLIQRGRASLIYGSNRILTIISYTWTHSTVLNQMNSVSIKNITCKQIVYMSKPDLELNNQHGLICHKILPTSIGIELLIEYKVSKPPLMSRTEHVQLCLTFVIWWVLYIERHLKTILPFFHSVATYHLRSGT